TLKNGLVSVNTETPIVPLDLRPDFASGLSWPLPQPIRDALSTTRMSAGRRMRISRCLAEERGREITLPLRARRTSRFGESGEPGIELHAVPLAGAACWGKFSRTWGLPRFGIARLDDRRILLLQFAGHFALQVVGGYLVLQEQDRIGLLSQLGVHLGYHL